MSLNYSQLKAAMYGYLSADENSLLNATDIDVVIQQAEQRIYRDVQIPVLKKNVTGNLSTGNRYLTTPDDYLATYSLAVNNNGTYEYLLPKEVEFMREAYPSTTATGVPRYYGIFDDNTFIVGPPPNQSYDVELHYYYEPPSIVSASQTWLGDNAEDALLYACLVELYTYLKGEQDLLQTYEARYQEAKNNLKLLGEGRNRVDTYRNEPPRMRPA